MNTRAPNPLLREIGRRTRRRAGEIIAVDGVEYTLLEPIGSGGEGEVWKATDGVKFSAIKAIFLDRGATDSGYKRELDRARFEVRAFRKAAAEFQPLSPGVPAMLGDGLDRDGKTFFVVMEWIDGRPIVDYANENNLDYLTRLRLATDVIEVVRVLHQLGIIHRDIKPANILVQSVGDRHVPRVVDFGLALEMNLSSAARGFETRPYECFGTPEYMPPECLEFGVRGATVSSDVYSLGVVMLELLTASLPYELPTESNEPERWAAAREALSSPRHPLPGDRLRMSITSGRLPTSLLLQIDQLTAAIDGPVGWMLQYALHEDPTTWRFRSAADLASAVTAVVGSNHEDIRRPKDGVQEHFFKDFRPTPPTAQQRLRSRYNEERQKYVAMLQGCSALLEAGNISGANGVLSAVPRRFRGNWEYQCLKIKLNPLLLVVNDPGGCGSASFSPDGEQIVTASFDGAARIWDARTGRPAGLLRGHMDSLASAAFSPDGKYVVTASYDKTARVWDWRSEQAITILEGHTEGVRSATFSADGTRILTASFDNTARIWDARTGLLLTNLNRHRHGVRCASFSSANDIVTTAGDGSVRLWRAPKYKLMRSWSLNEDVARVSFSSDSQRVVAASLHGSARIWSAAKRHGNHISLRGHGGAVNSARFNFRGTRVATASQDQTARIWDSESGEELAKFNGHKGGVLSAEFSPDGERLLTASYDKTFCVWDARDSAMRFAIPIDHNFYRAYFIRNGTGVAVDDRHQIREFEIPSRPLLGAQQLNNERASSAIEAGRREPLQTKHSIDRSCSVTQSVPKRLMLTVNGTVIPLRGHEGDVISAEFSSDNKFLATTSKDRTTRIWNVKTGAQLSLLRSANKESIPIAVRFSPDSRRALVFATPMELIRKKDFQWDIQLWDVSNGRLIGILDGYTGLSVIAEFSCDSERILVSCKEDSARLWHARNGLPLATLTQWVESAAFSPDATRVVTATTVGVMQVWDSESGDELFRLKSRRTSTILQVRFSGDGTMIQALGRDSEQWCLIVGEWDTVSAQDRFCRSQLSEIGGRNIEQVDAMIYGWAQTILARVQMDGGSLSEALEAVELCTEITGTVRAAVCDALKSIVATAKE
jgi:WD40 repeat protein/serine/threonine protein kinase